LAPAVPMKTDPVNPRVRLPDAVASPAAAADSLARKALAAIAVAAAYALGSILGLALLFPSLPVAAFWPANAILLAVLLLTRERSWWMYLLACFPVHLLLNGPRGVPLSVMLVQYAGNVGVALLGAVATRRFIDGPLRFDNFRAVALFMALAGVLAPVVVSLPVALLFRLLEWTPDVWLTWRARSLNNALAIFTLTPLIVLAINPIGPDPYRVPFRKAVEAGVLLVSLVAVGLIVFVIPNAGPLQSPALLYAPLPLLLWATVRFGLVGVSLSVLGLGALSLWGAVRGHGPFAAELPAQNVTSLLLFLNFSCVSLLVLGALLEERKKADAALRRSEERYREVVETQTEMICRYLPDSTLTFVNDAYCRYFERPREAIVGTKFIEFLPESERAAALQYVESLVHGQGSKIYEHHVLRPDGSVGWHQWIDHVILDAGGRVIELQGIGRDITALRQAELIAKERQQELTHLTRVATLGQLSGALAHELNQPLTAIRSNAQAALRFLAQEPMLLGEVRDILKDIVKDDQRAGDVIRHLRAMMMKRETERQPLNVNDVIAEALDLAHSDVVERRVSVDTRLAPELPSVHADPVQLKQVLLNLIGNACEAMSARETVERKLTITSAPDSGHTVRVSVMDRGTGLPPDAQRLFEPFFSTKEHGMGLGLSISRSIIAAHGGMLWATNNNDRGATFHFTLPAQMNAEPAARAEETIRGLAHSARG
jgi:PAS domain S-box-containing protein